MTPIRVYKIACLLLVGCGLLSGCGWQLQGTQRVPEHLSPLYLDLSDPHSAFARALQQRLNTAGVNVTAERSRAQSILRVSKDASGHHVSSVSALNEPQQYEVYYDIEYRLDKLLPESDNVLAPQVFNISRTMSYDKTLALAKQREEFALRDTLAAELADQIMRRLGRLSRSAPTAVNAADISLDKK